MLTTSKSDCICLSYGPMRLIRRRNNPNKETLINIPLSHTTAIPSIQNQNCNHAITITGIPNEKDISQQSGIITGISTSKGRSHNITCVITGTITRTTIITIAITEPIIIIITRLTHISRYVSRYRSQLTYIHI